MITPSRASRRSTGTTRPRRTRWSRRWSTTRTRWWRRSPGAELDEPAASALALLALVAGQDVEPAEGSDGTDGRWRIAQKVAEDRVISTVDPDARHTRKSPEARRDGYRAHLAADPETGIITDEKLTRASGGQLRPRGRGGVPGRRGRAGQLRPGSRGTATARTAPAAGAPRAQPRGQPAVRRQPLAWYGDSAYGTGDLRGAIADAGHRRSSSPSRCRPRSRAASPSMTSPSTSRPGRSPARPGTRPGSAGPASPPSASPCRDCPLRAQCTTCKTGRKLVLHHRDGLLRAARADWAADTGLRTGLHGSPAQRGKGRRPGRPPSGAAGSGSATAGRPRTTPGSSAAPPR